MNLPLFFEERRTHKVQLTDSEGSVQTKYFAANVAVLLGFSNHITVTDTFTYINIPLSLHNNGTKCS